MLPPPAGVGRARPAPPSSEAVPGKASSDPDSALTPRTPSLEDESRLAVASGRAPGPAIGSDREGVLRAFAEEDASGLCGCRNQARVPTRMSTASLSPDPLQPRFNDRPYRPDGPNPIPVIRKNSRLPVRVRSLSFASSTPGTTRKESIFRRASSAPSGSLRGPGSYLPHVNRCGCGVRRESTTLPVLATHPTYSAPTVALAVWKAGTDH